MPMNNTLYEVKQTVQFKRDYQLAKKRGQDLNHTFTKDGAAVTISQNMIFDGSSGQSGF
jgi:hypothetical protein